MLDNDLIRLNQKVNIVLMLRHKELYDALNPENTKINEIMQIEDDKKQQTKAVK
jgi:hypothetical protein